MKAFRWGNALVCTSKGIKITRRELFWTFEFWLFWCLLKRKFIHYIIWKLTVVFKKSSVCNCMAVNLNSKKSSYFIHSQKFWESISKLHKSTFSFFKNFPHFFLSRLCQPTGDLQNTSKINIWKIVLISVIPATEVMALWLV